MKKTLIFILITILSLTIFSSCKKNTEHNIEEYILQMNYKANFKILQLTDIHLGNKDDPQIHYDFMDLTIKDANPDLIVITGDLFTFAEKSTALSLFSWIDSHDIPWTVTFGNHDEQNYFPIEWLTNVLNNYSKNCLFKDIQFDNVFGNSNFAINLMSGTTIYEQLIFLDSNRYNYGEYVGYDYIRQDQIDWYEKLVTYTKEKKGSKVYSLAFFHIPFPEFEEAWNEYNNGNAELITGEKTEGFAIPKYNSGLFNKMVELGSTNGVFVGHDHLNCQAIKYQGITLSYGVTSTDRIYSTDEMIGGQVITIKSDHSLEIKQIFHTYKELEK